MMSILRSRSAAAHNALHAHPVAAGTRGPPRALTQAQQVVAALDDWMRDLRLTNTKGNSLFANKLYETLLGAFVRQEMACWIGGRP